MFCLQFLGKMNKKGFDPAVGNVITVAIVVILMFVVMIIFGPKLLGMGKMGTEFWSLDVCPQTGINTGEYEVLIQDLLTQGKQDEAVEKYAEFQACFPKKTIALPKSQIDVLDFHRAKKIYYTGGKVDEALVYFEKSAQSDNPFVAVEALYMEGKIYELEKDQANAKSAYETIVSKYSSSTLPEIQLRVGYAQWYLANIDEAIAAYSAALKSLDWNIKITAADGLIGIAEEHLKFCETYQLSPQEASVWKEDGVIAINVVKNSFKQGTSKYTEAEKVLVKLNTECK